MNDKIKVWKCEECSQPCFAAMLCIPSGVLGEPALCLASDTLDCKWKETNTYELTKNKPSKPKPTRYRLEIQYPVGKDEFEEAVRINDNKVDGEEVNYILSEDAAKSMVAIKIGNFTAFIKKSWLTPIVEEDQEPVTAEEFVAEYSDLKGEVLFSMEARERLMMECFIRGENNNELRHRERTSSQDAYSNYIDRGNASNGIPWNSAWQACLKSRGFDE